jgi:hypothetical protein
MLSKARMTRAHLAVVAVAALATVATGTALTAQPRRAPPTAPLYALSDADLQLNEHGCGCSFRVGRRELVSAINDVLVIRTRAGRQICRTANEEFSAISDGNATVRCAGIRMNVRRTGPLVVDGPSDSADGPARLTVTQGRMRRTLVGRWGCAC